MKRYPFHTAYTQARDFYGVELTPIDFENIGLVAWDKIGNKECKLYKYIVKPKMNSLGEYYVDLPCNLDIIEAVTATYEDYQKTTPTNNISGSNQSAWIEGYIESRKFHTNHLYVPGKYIKYRQEENKLFIADSFEEICILYKGIRVDETGLPYITADESDAIATFCAYNSFFKKALITKDPSTFQLAQSLEQKWKIKCTQSRVTELNQNEIDEILNVSVSWDRKRFGKSFKPIR